MLGISVYLQDFDADYVRSASAYVDYVFTSLHIMEEEFDKPKFLELLALCREIELKVICDISPNTFAKLGLRADQLLELKALGIETVRLDFGFEDQAYIEHLKQYFEVVFNASVIDPYTPLLSNKVSHNFYPLLGSGLSRKDFLEKNRLFKEKELKIQAFIAGDELKRFPLYAGLVTLEDHRCENAYVAGLEMFREYAVDDVLVGDSKISLRYLSYLARYLRDGIITIECWLRPELAHLYNQILQLRRDNGRDFWRIESERKSVEISHNGRRPRGAILQFNRLAKRYSGELYLARRDLAYDTATNQIGFVSPELVEVVDLLSGGDQICLLPIEL